MFDFHKPEWLYEALPYAYVMAGIATIANLGNTLSMVSGGLLISAGVFIWWMRRTHRQNQKRKEVDRRATDRREVDRRATERKEASRREAVRREAERRRRQH